MANYRRNFVNGGVYFFTVVTHERRPILTAGENIDRLREAFRRVSMDHPFHIDAIVILPDHLHTVWRLPAEDDDFSLRWRQIKRFFSIGIERRMGKAASHAACPASPKVSVSRQAKREKGVWQRRFWEHTLRDEDDWRRHVDYIHFNPVKHGYALRPGDWPFSSFPRAKAAGWYPDDWGEGLPASIARMHLE